MNDSLGAVPMNMKDMPLWERRIIGVAILAGPGIVCAIVVLSDSVPHYAKLITTLLALFVQTRLIRRGAHHAGGNDNDTDLDDDTD